MKIKIMKRFIIVDDDKFSNLLSKILLNKLFKNVEVKDFLFPESALEYIETEFEKHEEKITIFLDINMPTLTGWDFLKIFETLPDSLKNQFQIFVLSSSIDPIDIERAKADPLVIDFIEKPLSKAVLEKYFG
ncbi:MAG: two-component system response regulator [Flavobacterium sp.]